MQRRPCGIPTVGLVGGPGAGKSVIWEALRDREHIMLVPEGPTVLHGHGLWHPRDDPQFALDVDDFRRLLEAMASWSALERKAVMLVTDRIVGEGTWVYGGHEAIPGVEAQESVLARYQALILVAMPTEDVWLRCCHLNGARGERAHAQATALHERLERFIAPHPRIYRVGNEADMTAKVAAGVAIIDQLLFEVGDLEQQS
ncbi:MAG: AAA family ATPase [Patescibacteria group bacterium]